MNRQTSFFVPGHPTPQGSMVAGVNPHTGRAFVKHDNRENLLTWRGRITSRACDHWTDDPSEAPFFVSLRFWFRRPKSHLGSGRNANIVKPSAPAFPMAKKRSDIDKLERAVLDALSDVVWIDDAQVVSVRKFKRYTEPGHAEGVRIFAQELNDPTGLE